MNFTSSGWIAGEGVIVAPTSETPGAPDGTVVTSGAASAAGVVSFTGLGAGRFVATGLTSGRRVRFSVVAPAGRLDLTQGEATCDRASVQGSGVTTSAGTIRWGMFTAQRTEQVSALRAFTGGPAAAATPTLCRIGMWKVDAANNLTLVAATDNDPTLFAATNTGYTRPLLAPVVKEQGQRYALGVLVVSGVTTPNLAGVAGVAASGVVWLDDQVKAAAMAGHADLPAFVAAGSLIATAAFPYLAVF